MKNRQVREDEIDGFQVLGLTPESQEPMFLRQISFYSYAIAMRNKAATTQMRLDNCAGKAGSAISIRPHFWLSIFFASVMLTTSALAQQKDERVALVIGNAKYPDARTPLPTPIKDATKLADELRRINFSVEFKTNLSKEDMQRAIDAFTGKIKNGTTALFYFSGIGLQVGRRSYLIPVNAQIWTDADVRRDGISVDTLLAEAHRKGAKVKIVIIDAARRNPFERRFRASAAGLAPVEAPSGTLVLYSAAPGKLVQENGNRATSLFAAELLKELGTPDLSAEGMFNRTRVEVSRASRGEQVPWVASSLLEEFYFRGKPPGVAMRPSTQSPSPFPPAPEMSSPTSQPPKEPAHAALSPPREPSRGAFKPGDTFRDCAECPEMVVVPAGSFQMGNSNNDREKPVHQVSIAQPFAIGLREVTFDEWDRCVSEQGCKFRPGDRGWGRQNRPVINVSWADAKEFVTWLSQKTGQVYRLPSEAEWEYAARGGTSTPFWWGRAVGARHANCRQCSTGETEQTLPAGTYKPNPFGLFDTAGNAAEWVEDCWNDDYHGAPADGSAWTKGQCRLRVLRGGSFDSESDYVRSNARFRYDVDVRYSGNGFRVVRQLQ
jgi:formylglycine-generating enzyme required for sulfatase activity